MNAFIKRLQSANKIGFNNAVVKFKWLRKDQHFSIFQTSFMLVVPCSKYALKLKPRLQIQESLLRWNLFCILFFSFFSKYKKNIKEWFFLCCWQNSKCKLQIEKYTIFFSYKKKKKNTKQGLHNVNQTFESAWFINVLSDTKHNHVCVLRYSCTTLSKFERA